jgi:hypothetical protein
MRDDTAFGDVKARAVGRRVEPGLKAVGQHAALVHDGALRRTCAADLRTPGSTTESSTAAVARRGSRRTGSSAAPSRR